MLGPPKATSPRPPSTVPSPSRGRQRLIDWALRSHHTFHNAFDACASPECLWLLYHSRFHSREYHRAEQLRLPAEPDGQYIAAQCAGSERTAALLLTQTGRVCARQVRSRRRYVSHTSRNYAASKHSNTMTDASMQISAPSSTGTRSKSLSTSRPSTPPPAPRNPPPKPSSGMPSSPQSPRPGIKTTSSTPTPSPSCPSNPPRNALHPSKRPRRPIPSVNSTSITRSQSTRLPISLAS